MNGTLFRQIQFNLSGLIDAVGRGQIGLPDLQRPFVWPNKKVRELFDSMYRGYPVGSLLLWENGGDAARPIGVDAKQVPPQLLVIDGQQRLTSLYAVMRGMPVRRESFQEERIYIAFCPLDDKFEVADAAIRKDPRWIPDISVIWSPEIGLLEVLRNYLEGLEPVESADRQRIEQAIQRLHGLTHFPFTALQLAGSLDDQQVSDVFVRINSQGTTLNQADFILTLMSVFRDQKRVELETFCRRARVPSKSADSPFNHFLEPKPEQLLRVSVGVGFRRARLQHVYSILRGKDLESGEFTTERREQQFSVLDEAQRYVLDLGNWKEFLKCLLQAGYRSGSMISSHNALLYAYVYYLLGKRDFGVERHRLHRALARWFFFVALTGRYTVSSPESRMEQDLADLRGIRSADGFVEHLERTIASVFTGDYWRITLPGDLATSAARSPALFAYYAALNLLDARALFSDLKIASLLDPVAHDRRSALERHHLFPKAHLQRSGVASRRDVNQIANFALVEWPDNSAISDRPPSEYFPELLRRQGGLSAEIRFWHALPEDWETMEYPRFLESRRQLIAEVIRRGFEVLASAREVPASEEIEVTATDQVLLQLGERTRSLFRELLSEPLLPTETRRQEVFDYLFCLERPSGLESVDVDTARLIADRCGRLLDRIGDGASPELRRLVQAACLYFTLEDDVRADRGANGFDDDLAVVTAIESVIPGAARLVTRIRET